MENTGIDLDLAAVAGGAVPELARTAVADVLKNMQDTDTPWRPKRTVTIILGFTQNENRDDVTMQISVKEKTEPVKPVETKFSVGTDLRTGRICMEEYGPQIRGQMSLGDYMPSAGPEPGAETGKVTDFRVKEA